ncbi:hypothetical protein DL96DRAFT_1541412 [Flagelloscypha sp. PMI_526]|nr:hypothetical protein DL96DRAFT_1541412 [Flagelloscypha sp. PMI_526]
MALELDRNSGFVSLRRSLIWYTEGQTQIAPDADVVVIVSSKTGYFVDVRFLKESGELEWAFAGYKENRKNQETRFVHLIDSRTIDVSQVEDIGISSQHPTDLTLTYERGRMLNPGTSKLEDFEELWSDEQPQSVLILRSQNENTATQEWIAQSDTWQIGIIRTGKGRRKQQPHRSEGLDVHKNA